MFPAQALRYILTVPFVSLAFVTDLLRQTFKTMTQEKVLCAMTKLQCKSKEGGPCIGDCECNCAVAFTHKRLDMVEVPQLFDCRRVDYFVPLALAIRLKGPYERDRSSTKKKRVILMKLFSLIPETVTPPPVQLPQLKYPAPFRYLTADGICVFDGLHSVEIVQQKEGGVYGYDCANLQKFLNEPNCGTSVYKVGEGSVVLERMKTLAGSDVSDTSQHSKLMWYIHVPDGPDALRHRRALEALIRQHAERLRLRFAVTLNGIRRDELIEMIPFQVELLHQAYYSGYLEWVELEKSWSQNQALFERDNGINGLGPSDTTLMDNDAVCTTEREGRDNTVITLLDEDSGNESESSNWGRILVMSLKARIGVISKGKILASLLLMNCYASPV